MLLLFGLVLDGGSYAAAGLSSAQADGDGGQSLPVEEGSFELVCWQEGREILRKAGHGTAEIGKQFLGRELVSLRHLGKNKGQEVKLLSSNDVTCLLSRGK